MDFPFFVLLCKALFYTFSINGFGLFRKGGFRFLHW